MTQNIRFTGGDKLEGLEKKIHEAFMVTELNSGKDAYKISYGEEKEGGKSGLSFGGNQMDLVNGKDEYKELFINIMADAKNQADNFIISKEDLKTIKLVYLTRGKYPSTVFGDLLPKVNSALASKYGVEKINEMYSTELKGKIQHVKEAIALLTHEDNKKLLNTDPWIVKLVDFHNKFNIELPQKGKDFKDYSILKFLNGEEVTLKNYEYGSDGEIKKDKNGIKIVKTTHKLKLADLINNEEFEKFIKSTNDYNKSEAAKKGIDNRLAKLFKVLVKQEFIDEVQKYNITEENAEKLFASYTDEGHKFLLEKSTECLTHYANFENRAYKFKGHMQYENGAIKNSVSSAHSKLLDKYPGFFADYKPFLFDKSKGIQEGPGKLLHLTPNPGNMFPPSLPDVIEVYQIDMDKLHTLIEEEAKERSINCFNDALAEANSYLKNEKDSKASYFAAENDNEEFEPFESMHYEL